MSTHLKPSVNEQDHVQGTVTATIEIVEYGDYQCPYCGEAYPIIKRIQQKYGKQIRFVFRNFPLTEIHAHALPAAIAAEAAALQGKFWEMHDSIYENQQDLSAHNLLALASKTGLNIEKFQQDIQLEKLQEKVEYDFESGVRSGVNGTPSFFINGNKFDGGATDLEELLADAT